MAPLRELSRALRTLRRSPGSAVIAVFALGLGIGLCALVFSMIQAVMVRGLPFHDPDQLVEVYRRNPTRGSYLMPTIHDYAAWRESGRAFADLGAYYSGTVNLSGGGTDQVPERMRGAFITPSVLSLLGVRPAAGRLFVEEDDQVGAPPVILLGWDVWQQRFQGDPGVVGRVIRANGVETVVVGVLPAGFGFPESQQVWLPLRLDASRISWENDRYIGAIGRLKPGVTMAAATTDLDRVAARLAQEHPDTHRGLTVQVSPFGRLSDRNRAMLLIMFAAVIAVLMIACVNVANLLIGRAIVRTKEVGIRMALGAGRFQVAAPFLAESTVLAAGGALLGIAVAHASLRVFVHAIEVHNPPFWLRFTIDGTVLGFIALAAVGAAILAGAIPAWQAARLSMHDTLKDESRGATGFRLGRLSSGLVVAEIALSLGLLAGAGLMVRSVLELNATDLGVPGKEIFVARVALPAASYAAADAQRRFAADLQTRLEAMPGAESVAVASGWPGRGGGSGAIAIEGQSDTDDHGLVYAMVPIVSTGYFATFDARPIRGRVFTPADAAGALPVALVNRAFERRYLGAGNGLGRRIRVGGPDQPWLTVVGVVPDLLESGVQNWRPEAVYRPIAQFPIRFIAMAVRTAAHPLDLTAPVREQVRALDADLPIYDINTLHGAVQDANFMTGLFAGLFGAFGSAALLLAAVGLYGVMSFSVNQRRREVGVRMALGANSADVLRLVLLRGMRQVALGLALGTVLAYALARGIASALFGVSPLDPLALAGTVLVLVAVAALACVVPAIRATHTDPLEALRAE